MKICISCASQDKKIAEKIEEDLKKQNVTPWIYTKSIKPGRIWLKELDEVLAEADYVLGVVTKNYLSSVGGIEAYAKIAENIKKKDIGFIPLFFINPKQLKSPIIKSIQGINFYSQSYEDGLKELLQFLKEKEPESAKELLSKIESPESYNPFRRVRAEYFRENYELLAKAFAVPEREKYELLQEDRPIFIFGGRGSGKTMLLKSLTPRVLLYRLNAKTYKELREKGVNFLGIYFRLEKGSFLIYDNNIIVEMGFIQTRIDKKYELYKDFQERLNRIKQLSSEEIEDEPVLMAGLNAAWAISLNEINLKILKTVLTELINLSNPSSSVLNLPQPIERRVTEEILKKMEVKENINSFPDLIKFIDGELLKISKYLQDLYTPFAEPRVNWCRTGIKFLDEVFKIIRDNIEELKDITFYLLFDEFENLHPIQQTIIIEWVKTAQNFVPKIASKFEGMYTNMTLQGQPLQFGEDCPHPIELDYNLFDNYQKEKYQYLLKNICRNLLEIEGYKNKDISSILEKQEELEISQTEIDKEIEKIRKNAGLEFKPEKIKEYRNKLQTAAIFRLLRERRKVEGRKSRRKVYAGFETYTYLSSGIIRVFLNLVGMAVYIAEGEGINVKNGESIPVECQTRAAYIVSKAWLEKIPENHEFKEYGEKIYQFVVDIGDILRERLLNHPTEPESLAITIIDPINISRYNELDQILSYCERESIFYKRKETSAYKPKQSGEPRVREYILNRIYAPIMGLSYSSRWGRNKITTNELAELLDENKRKQTLRNLKMKIKKENIEDITLFNFGGEKKWEI